jgi:hypothetical protein
MEVEETSVFYTELCQRAAHLLSDLAQKLIPELGEPQ